MQGMTKRKSATERLCSGDTVRATVLRTPTDRIVRVELIHTAEEINFCPPDHIEAYGDMISGMCARWTHMEIVGIIYKGLISYESMRALGYHEEKRRFYGIAIGLMPINLARKYVNHYPRSTLNDNKVCCTPAGTFICYGLIESRSMDWFRTSPRADADPHRLTARLCPPAAPRVVAWPS